jgi:uncharacterized repeat protein (TIGR03803 family)
MSTFNWWTRAGALFLLWAATAVALPAQTFKTLHNFDETDGAYPYAGLIQGTDGELYGATAYSGSTGYFYAGTIFEITSGGTLKTLYNFCKPNCTDGAQPFGGMVLATDGNFYGTTAGGGTKGYGTAFKMTPSGELTPLHSFDYKDGATPYGRLLQGTDGNFYGTTTGGGTSPVCATMAGGCGTVFKMTPSGELKTLYNFCSQSDCTDGKTPKGGLVQGTNGDFYGTTVEGGAIVGFSYGTVFEMTPSGELVWQRTFEETKNGAYPYAGLVQGTNGDFYGTTEGGGVNDGDGTVFQVTPSGELTTLHTFRFTATFQDGDGVLPYAGLVQGTDGNFYGTTHGYHGYGTIFRITPSGELTKLFSFDGTDGHEPYAGLVQGTDGDFYGTTYAGGTDGYGTVFSLSVGLGPFVETQPDSGAVGAAVKILGTDLTGATKVTFNGTEATFTVDSSSEISTTVPADATTGTVKVIDPSGTLSSNVVFRVTP